VGTYHVAQICKNGHVINTSADRYPESNQYYCEKCGAPTIMRCESWGAPIRGYYEVSGVISTGEHYERPSFCYKCGSIYPWTRSELEAAKALAATFAHLSEEERKELEKSLDDLVQETPQSKVAELNFKRVMKKVGSDGYDSMRSILVGIVSEAIRKSLFRM